MNIKSLNSFKTFYGLILLASAIYVGSFFFPYWVMHLKAPQYPTGLHMQVYLDHVEGDVGEVNLLNHYIGMEKLESAAKLEREVAVLALGLLVLGGLIALGFYRKVHFFFYFPPILFLIGFIVDFSYWMYRFGHNLSHEAPVHIKPFTPQILGIGKIGQFHTHAMFGTGFWLGLLATCIYFIAIRMKQKLLK